MSDVITLSVPGMSCGNCQQAIEGAVGAVAGVSAVRVELPAKSVAVTYDAPADRSAIDAAIEDAGYEVAAFTEGSGS
jgi:copper chaperone